MIQFRIQSTPNPNARKYVVSEEVKATGRVTYTDKEECKHVPLARAIMNTKGIKQVHFFENVVTVTQDGSMDWSSLDSSLQEIIVQAIPTHDIFFKEYTEANSTKTPKELTGELKKIDEILEKTIRPSLQMDGGDIELVEFEQSILTVKYMGACGDCPSSMTATLSAIQNLLRTEYNEEITVAVV
jgi:Fe-S cluster biogenesis protein NfuA